MCEGAFEDLGRSGEALLYCKLVCIKVDIVMAIASLDLCFMLGFGTWRNWGNILYDKMDTS